MGIFSSPKVVGSAAALVILSSLPASAAVFNFNQGLAFNKGGSNPGGFDFSVLHVADSPSDASGTVTHRLDNNRSVGSLPASAQADLVASFDDDIGGSLSYSIDNGAGPSDITAAGALNGAVVTLGENIFRFDAIGGMPSGTLRLGGSFTLTGTNAFDGDIVDTPFGIAEPEYQIGGTDLHFTFEFDSLSGDLANFGGTFELMGGTMGPFNGLAVGAGNRADDVTFYIWAASAGDIDCGVNDCDYHGQHFAMDLSAWGTAVPEPTTMALIGAGIIGMAGIRRRRVRV